MKAITSDYKNAIKTLGRELDTIISYTSNNTLVELGGDMLNSITLHYEGDILKSVMKQLDIDSNQDIPIGTKIECEFGVYVDDDYEYISFGNFYVYSSEKQEDTKSYKLVCYDKMLNSMKDYHQVYHYTATTDTTFNSLKNYYEYDDGYILYDGDTTGNPSTLELYERHFITYPITIRNYLSAICDTLNITFASISDNFTNYNREIPNELFLDANGEGLDYTFRDVLDQVAEITASTICINDDDELEVRYITATNDTIDEEFLKDVNVNFGEAYGPINTITFKRSADADAISVSRPENLPNDQKNEIAISENQFLNDDNRADYIDAILDRLYGLTYYINDYVSTGITYYDLCDRYNVQITDEATNITTTYSCVMLNDEIQITQGLVENVHTDMPGESETDYNTTSKDDRSSSRTSLIVDKINHEIRSIVENTEQVDIIVNGKTEYVLTSDTTYQDDKVYYTKDGNEYNELNRYRTYIGARTGNPTTLGLYQGLYTTSYSLTNDTEFDDGDYYVKNGDNYELYTGARTGNPHELGLYDKIETLSGYELTTDTEFIEGKTYFQANYNIGDTIPENTIYEQVRTPSVSEQVEGLDSKIDEQIKIEDGKITTITNSVETLETNTYTKTQINSIATGTGYFLSVDKKFNNATTYYSKSGNTYTEYTGARTGDPSELGLYEYGRITAVASETGTFDKDGLEIKKVDANNNVISDTIGRFNERGVQLKDKDNNEIFFSGYVEEGDTRFDVGSRKYAKDTIVYTKNLQSPGETILGNHCLIQDYLDGTGWFVL